VDWALCSSEIDKARDEVIELLAEMPLRAEVHPFGSGSDAKSGSEGSPA